MSYFLNGITQHYADFGGRASRKEFWMYTLFASIAALAAMLLDTILGTTIPSHDYGLIYILAALALSLPGLAIGVRRLHDVGKSGWFYFIVLIPLAGPIWLLIVLCRAGQPTNNEYGKNPMTRPLLSSTSEPEHSAISLSQPQSRDERLLTRACPECGEAILSVARKCKHCHSVVTPEVEKSQVVETLMTDPSTRNRPAPTQLIGKVILVFLFVVALGFALPAVFSWQNNRDIRRQDHRALGLPDDAQTVSAKGAPFSIDVLTSLKGKLSIESCHRRDTMITCLAKANANQSIEGSRIAARATTWRGTQTVSLPGAFVSAPRFAYGQTAELKVQVPAEADFVYLSYR